MAWFFLTLIGSFLYALTNHIDKILLSKYFKKGGVGTLMLFSSLLSGLALPFLFWADPTVFDTTITNIIILFVVGLLSVSVLWLYFIALKDEEVSVAIVFTQLVPVFGLILGYFILDEVLSKIQLIAMAIIILGTTIVSFEIDTDNKFTLRRQTIALMLMATFFWALGSTTFKFIALEESVIRSLFWEHLTLTFVGVILFIFFRTYRTDFLNAIKINSRKILLLNVSNEIFYMFGNIIISFSYLMAPVAIILLINSFQPIFVFVIGIFFTLFFPKISAEKIRAKYLLQKLLAISVTGIGTYILLSSS